MYQHFMAIITMMLQTLMLPLLLQLHLVAASQQLRRAHITAAAAAAAAVTPPHRFLAATGKGQ